MKISWKLIIALALALLIVWAYVSAPTPLPDSADSESTASIAIEDLMKVIAAENDIARTLYTESIVGAGKVAGLKFSEHWKRSPIPLGLFLGSDHPISSSNRFSGTQELAFETMKENQLAPQFFLDEDTERHTGMFADLASVQACATCHNEHPDSPKTDWVLNDVMGATTWTYPKKRVTTTEAVAILTAVRQGFSDAYQGYLNEASSFDPALPIGEEWPGEQATIPNLETFIAEFERRASTSTLKSFLAL
jgi:adenylate cyclase